MMYKFNYKRILKSIEGLKYSEKEFHGLCENGDFFEYRFQLDSGERVLKHRLRGENKFSKSEIDSARKDWIIHLLQGGLLKLSYNAENL